MEMIIFVGIQATGKSEFYKQYFYRTHMRLNLDMLKTRNREKLLMEACIEARQPFVIDNTNATAKDRERYIRVVKDAGFRIIGYYFQSSINDALARNANRTGKERVPDTAILGTHKKLELPNYDEGFDELWYVRMSGDMAFTVEEYTDEI